MEPYAYAYAYAYAYDYSHAYAYANVCFAVCVFPVCQSMITPAVPVFVLMPVLPKCSLVCKLLVVVSSRMYTYTHACNYASD